ncbi:hypothetical protein HID58_047150 [Brassica napus]|uniref:Bet v I/Major latex protein domain-containing protein n=1 Tax=Brassica napus TaxID=3708 RepID=A0ABQ8AYK9_BRANA|nr:hypothetical protein HID58_047150 [Brassica napus]
MAEASTLVGKLETDVEIKASAGKFHHMFAGRPHHVSKATPGNIQNCELHEGNWGKVDGEAKVAKERVEAVEPEKNLITFRVVEGDLLKEYKSFVITIQVTPKHGGPGSVVHWHLEYEKISDEVAHPETLLQFCKWRSKLPLRNGEPKVAKDIIEAVDREKNLFKMRVIEGDLVKEYKNFVLTIQATPKHDGSGSIVHWLIEYEKISEEVAHPETLVQLLTEMSQGIDEHLLTEE